MAQRHYPTEVVINGKIFAATLRSAKNQNCDFKSVAFLFQKFAAAISA